MSFRCQHLCNFLESAFLLLLSLEVPFSSSCNVMQAGFPADEAASVETLEFRQREGAHGAARLPEAN
jgi:hypothetical protein